MVLQYRSVGVQCPTFISNFSDNEEENQWNPTQMESMLESLSGEHFFFVADAHAALVGGLIRL